MVADASYAARRLLHGFLLGAAFWLMACGPKEGGWTREQYRQAATALFQQQLYLDAVQLYEAYLKSPALSAEDAPKVLYQIGVIQQDHMRDCPAALAKFTVLKALYPEETFNGQVGKRTVSCLETVGRSADASQALANLTSMNPQDSNAAGSGDVVAELDGRKITLGEVASAFGKLPDDAKGRYDATRSYVAQILVAQAAHRKGLTEKPEIKKRLAQIEDQVLAGEMLREEVQVPMPSANDLKYFYEGNKARYQSGADSGKSLQDLQAKVAADWQREKAAERTNAYIENLLRAAQVTFHTPQGGSPSP